MKTALSMEKVREAILSLGEELEEAEAIGICGSLARGDFHERSDIDVFIVVKEKPADMDIDRIWWDRIREAMQGFERDITVLVYPIKALKKIVTWYVLRLASEGILIYDRAEVESLFKRIVETARKAGLVEREIGTHKVWSTKNLKLSERPTLELKE